jgi:hypothetical protein
VRALGVVVLAGHGRQEVEGEVPLARDDAVEALPHGVRVDVGDEASEPAPVAVDGAPVLAPHVAPRRERGGERRPEVLAVELGVVSGDHRCCSRPSGVGRPG